MKVYEMIRELAKFDPNMEVSISDGLAADGIVRTYIGDFEFCDADRKTLDIGIGGLEDAETIAAIMGSINDRDIINTWRKVKNAVNDGDRGTIDSLIQWLFVTEYDSNVVDFANRVSDYPDGIDGYAMDIVSRLDRDGQYMALFTDEGELILDSAEFNRN
jgi:hypothetical protein